MILEENEKPADLTERIIFKKKVSSKTDKSGENSQQESKGEKKSKTKKAQHKSKLSFDIENDQEDEN